VTDGPDGPTPLSDTLVDWARVATGFAVLGVQQAQVWRRQLEKDARPVIEPIVKAVRQRLAAAAQAEQPAGGQATER
jgi:hypothetical protein